MIEAAGFTVAEKVVVAAGVAASSLAAALSELSPAAARVAVVDAGVAAVVEAGFRAGFTFFRCW